MLLQCIGVKEAVEPQFLSGRLVPGACYLLCSDGFRHEVSKQEIREKIEEEVWEKVKSHNNQEGIMKGMNRALDRLISMSKSRGERDNISAILIQTMEEIQAC